MKRLTLFSALALAALALAGCGTTSGSPTELLDAIGRNYAHCQRTITYSAQVGALNPSSGVAVSGSVNCPPQAVAPFAGDEPIQ